MNKGRASFLSASFVAFLVAASLASTAHAADSAAGIYKGSYASYAPGGDYGAVTIVINDQGGTVCDFYSTPNGYGAITTGGSVTSTAPFLGLTCANSGLNNGGAWYATSNSPSVAGGSVSGTWTRVVGPITNSPTGSFEATYVSGLAAINPAAMAGSWFEPGVLGIFNFLPANAGLVVTYIGVNTVRATTTTGQPIGPALGSPLWLVSEVGPKTILPGTPVNLKMYSPAAPTADQPVPSGVTPWGSIAITFLDCHTAAATLSGPITSFVMNLQILAGVAGGPGC
ncbi:hypothetical protein GCM10009105_04000 [Dokdonella soli]|uniref:PEP-CTERM sorting domain-containing protein n=2 Tax=Dokdonella soli TaxID=529810 RepID=A0ABN1IC53_9GAMM